MKKWLKRIGGALVVVIALAVTFLMCFYVYKLKNESELAQFEDSIRNIGVWGIPVMLLIQILQVVLAIIPGEPIELAMGALYGTFGGCLLCLVGIAVGTTIIFLGVKRFGRKFVENFISGEKFTKLKFLKDPSKRDVLLFLLMFIPGTPKDTLTYFAPFTGVSFARFLVISTVARIPSVITSSYIGSNIMDGNYIRGIVAFVIVGIVSLAGIIIYNKIVESKNCNNKEIPND